MLVIRAVQSDDAQAIAHICLLTGNAGLSAEHLHSPSRGNLLGSVWALPYVHLPYTWGFVLSEDETNNVKGYILGATDSEAFARAEEETWWPQLRSLYPITPTPDEEPRTEADQRYIELIHRGPDPPLKTCLALSSAHMHIDLLPEVQRKGWGRKLIARAVDHLRERGLDAVWLGMDPSNEAAGKFYERLGFGMIEGAPSDLRVLKFVNWSSG